MMNANTDHRMIFAALTNRKKDTTHVKISSKLKKNPQILPQNDL